MDRGEENQGNQDEVVRGFLEQFDGDPVTAARAIQSYARRQLASHNSDRRPRPAPVGDPLLSLQGVTKTYKLGRQKIDVLRGVDCAVYEGEFVVITGASGSGKSTLLQLMGGLDTPTSGDIVHGVTNIGALSDRNLSLFRQKTVGFIFQFFYLQPFLRLRQNLEVPLMFARVPRKVRRERARQLADRVGLLDRIEHYPRELSGGQVQRAAIARALMVDPKILLADEPTGNLDSANSRAIIQLFKEIQKELGMTIVVVTHDEQIARQADREIRIADGKVVFA